jgi:hypothetical protein
MDYAPVGHEVKFIDRLESGKSGWVFPDFFRILWYSSCVLPEKGFHFLKPGAGCPGLDCEEIARGCSPLLYSAWHDRPAVFHQTGEHRDMGAVHRDRYPEWIGRCGRFVLKLIGWKMLGVRPDVKKCVIVCAPHTTNWDLFFFMLGTLCYQVPAMFTMKKFWFFWPLGLVWRFFGGIPIDRRAPGNQAEKIAACFGEYDALRLGIPPEGTRKNAEYWKTGFYWIARNAGVPLLLSHLDYEKREMKLATLIYPTEDAVADLTRIRAYYQNHLGITPRFRLLEEHEAGERAV